MDHCQCFMEQVCSHLHDSSSCLPRHSHRPLSPQLLRGLRHIHSANILHRSDWALGPPAPPLVPSQSFIHTHSRPHHAETSSHPTCWSTPRATSRSATSTSPGPGSPPHHSTSHHPTPHLSDPPCTLWRPATLPHCSKALPAGSSSRVASGGQLQQGTARLLGSSTDSSTGSSTGSSAQCGTACTAGGVEHEGCLLQVAMWSPRLIPPHHITSQGAAARRLAALW